MAFYIAKLLVNSVDLPYDPTYGSQNRYVTVGYSPSVILSPFIAQNKVTPCRRRRGKSRRISILQDNHRAMKEASTDDTEDGRFFLRRRVWMNSDEHISHILFGNNDKIHSSEIYSWNCSKCHL